MSSSNSKGNRFTRGV